MSAAMKIRRILFGATTAATCCTLIVGMACDAPLILYPITSSLPPGLYVKTFELPTVGAIAAFPIPKAAQGYKKSIGEVVSDDFLFMKPIIAGPGDHVCNQSGKGLFINGALVTSTSAHDRSGRALPVWRGCRRLLDGEFFTLSTHSPNSFDGRHYGPTKEDDIRGTYRAQPS